MRPYRSTHPLRALAVLTPLMLAACAGDPMPDMEMGAAEQAIRSAEQAGAGQYAPVELETARSKMDAARLAVRKDEEDRARRFAVEAQADANFAASKARAGAAQSAASVANRDWQALSGTTGTGGTAGTGTMGTGTMGTGTMGSGTTGAGSTLGGTAPGGTATGGGLTPGGVPQAGTVPLTPRPGAMASNGGTGTWTQSGSWGSAGPQGAPQTMMNRPAPGTTQGGW